MSLCTIKTFTDYGPYFESLAGSYQAASLKDLLFHVRLCMADDEDLIGLIGPDGACRGIFCKEQEWHRDSSGAAVRDHRGYVLLRPGTDPAALWHQAKALLS